MPAPSLSLDELFVSLQGEAFELGRPQLFLRLAGCPLRCSYCDTPRSWKATGFFERHEAGRTLERSNPLDAPGLDAELGAVLDSHRLAPEDVTLALTGGEPLEQTEFLLEWLPTWGGRVMLETAGIHAARLARLLPHVDQLSLDWKLPATLRRGSDQLESEACLRAMVEAGVQGWVKLVVTADSEDAELREAMRRIAAMAPGVDVYLQPVTHFGNGPLPPSGEQLLAWSLAHADLDCTVRVVPQIHPLLGAR